MSARHMIALLKSHIAGNDEEFLGSEPAAGDTGPLLGPDTLLRLMKLSILIPVYNEGAVVEGAISQVAAAALPWWIYSKLSAPLEGMKTRLSYATGKPAA
jgi:hypothetical protein